MAGRRDAPAARARPAHPAEVLPKSGDRLLHSATVQHMETNHTTRPPRPYRLMVNLDAETRDALRAMSAASGVSQSYVAADALRLLVPMMRPVTDAIGKLREQPQQAMQEIAAHAELMGQQAKAVISEVRAAARRQPKAPPSSNTGG